MSRRSENTQAMNLTLEVSGLGPFVIRPLLLAGQYITEAKLRP